MEGRTPKLLLNQGPSELCYATDGLVGRSDTSLASSSSLDEHLLNVPDSTAAATAAAAVGRRHSVIIHCVIQSYSQLAHSTSGCLSVCLRLYVSLCLPSCPYASASCHRIHLVIKGKGSRFV